MVKQAIFPNFVKGLTSQIGQKLAYFVSEFKRSKLENAKFGFTNWMISSLYLSTLEPFQIKEKKDRLINNPVLEKEKSK